GSLVLEDHARTVKGGEEGSVLVAGKSEQSKLWRMLVGKAEPKMPPADNPAPKPEEIALIQAWIDAGAKPPMKGPAGLITPKISPEGEVGEPIAGLAVDLKGEWLAVARPAGVAILSTKDQSALKELTGHSGAISNVSLSADGKWLVVAAGEIGLGGEATLWNT